MNALNTLKLRRESNGGKTLDTMENRVTFCRCNRGVCCWTGMVDLLGQRDQNGDGGHSAALTAALLLRRTDHLLILIVTLLLVVIVVTVSLRDSTGSLRHSPLSKPLLV